MGDVEICVKPVFPAHIETKRSSKMAKPVRVLAVEPFEQVPSLELTHGMSPPTATCYFLTVHIQMHTLNLIKENSKNN